MDRAQRQAESGGQALERGSAQAVGHNGLRGADGAAAGEAGACHPAIRPEQAGSAPADGVALRVGSQESADPGEQPARIHLVVGGNAESAGDARAQEGLPRPRLADGQRLHREAVRLLDGAQVRERPAVGGVGPHGEGRRREVPGAGVCPCIRPCASGSAGPSRVRSGGGYAGRFTGQSGGERGPEAG